jgi:hypothetical protein
LARKGPLAPREQLLIARTLLGFVVSATGLRAGLRRWRLHPRALITTRVYLVLLAIGGVVGLRLPSEFGFSITLSDLYVATVTVAGSAFWLLYFSHSRRVKATYALAGR